MTKDPMPPPTLTNGTSTTGMPAWPIASSVHTRSPMRSSPRSPGSTGGAAVTTGLRCVRRPRARSRAGGSGPDRGRRRRVPLVVGQRRCELGRVAEHLPHGEQRVVVGELAVHAHAREHVVQRHADRPDVGRPRRPAHRARSAGSTYSSDPIGLMPETVMPGAMTLGQAEVGELPAAVGDEDVGGLDRRGGRARPRGAHGRRGPRPRSPGASRLGSAVGGARPRTRRGSTPWRRRTCRPPGRRRRASRGRATAATRRGAARAPPCRRRSGSLPDPDLTATNSLSSARRGGGSARKNSPWLPSPRDRMNGSRRSVHTDALLPPCASDSVRRGSPSPCRWSHCFGRVPPRSRTTSVGRGSDARSDRSDVRSDDAGRDRRGRLPRHRDHHRRRPLRRRAGPQDRSAGRRRRDHRRHHAGPVVPRGLSPATCRTACSRPRSAPSSRSSRSSG